MSSKFENIFRINRKSLFATLGGFETSGAFFLGYTYIWSTVHSFAALGAMMMKSSSFESPKPIDNTLKNNVVAFMRSVRISWKVRVNLLHE